MQGGDPGRAGRVQLLHQLLELLPYGSRAGPGRALVTVLANLSLILLFIVSYLRMQEALQGVAGEVADEEIPLTGQHLLESSLLHPAQSTVQLKVTVMVLEA